MMRRTLPLAALLAAWPMLLGAQNSTYGILGIGFPNSPFSVRARALGGSVGPVDPQSLLNPAAVASLTGLTVHAASAQEYRKYTIGGLETGGLQQTRFPYVVVGGRVGSAPLSYVASYTAYAERTFDVVTSDTIVLRGQPVGVSDRTSSIGAVVDIRGALAWAASRGMSVGLAGHVLGGSARLATGRQFSDSAYREFTDVVEADFSGLGLSAGLVAAPLPGLRLGASARVDSRLSRRVNGQNVGEVRLPVTLAGGVEMTLAPAFRLSGSGVWRSWSRAAPDVAADTKAFDTWETGWGIELGGAPRGPRLPLRLGIRYAKLPFSPTTEQPRELDLAGGTALTLGRGRVKVDVTVERALRDGGGAKERAWQFSLGVQLQP